MHSRRILIWVTIKASFSAFVFRICYVSHLFSYFSLSVASLYSVSYLSLFTFIRYSSLTAAKILPEVRRSPRYNPQCNDWLLYTVAPPNKRPIQKPSGTRVDISSKWSSHRNDLTSKWFIKGNAPSHSSSEGCLCTNSLDIHSPMHIWEWDIAWAVYY